MYAVLRPLLFRLDPERAHHLVFGATGALGPLGTWGARGLYGAPDARLAVEIAGVRFASPIGLAAGLDKDGKLPKLWAALGFGAVELGTVTAHAQTGNPKPRLFRVPEAGALINRMGFNNGGSDALAGRLRTMHGTHRVPIGVNIGKSKVTPLDEAVGDYALSTTRVAEMADYLVVNVSSPNTPGLRRLQDGAALAAIVEAVVARALGRPVFVKLSPDLTDEALADAVSTAESAGAHGIIATNTTVEHGAYGTVGPGGLSGRPLRARAQAVIARVCANTDLPVIGVGGIATVADILDCLSVGAQAVQIYSALIFQGPGLIKKLNRGLCAELDRRGLESITDLRQALMAVRP